MNIFSKISQHFANLKKRQDLEKGIDVFWNGDFYFVESKVCQGTLRDPDGINFYYDTGVENADLGSGVVACLNKSWNLDDSEDAPLIHAAMARRNASTYPARLADEMKRFGYKHLRARSQSMLKVIVKLRGKNITLEPTNHISLENWTEEKIDPIDHLNVNSDVNNAEMGRLVKLAFERCKNDLIEPIPKKKKDSSPTSIGGSKNVENDIYEISLLCNGDIAAAKDIWHEIQKSSDSHLVLLGPELSKNGYGFSSNWKGALANFQDAFEKFVAHFDIKNIAFNEIEDSIYSSTDIFDCLVLANAWLSKYEHKMMYLNELPDMCELVLIKNSDLKQVSSYLKRSRGFELEPISVSFLEAGEVT